MRNPIGLRLNPTAASELWERLNRGSVTNRSEHRPDQKASRFTEPQTGISSERKRFTPNHQRPSGLHGDIEHIVFKESFRKINNVQRVRRWRRRGDTRTGKGSFLLILGSCSWSDVRSKVRDVVRGRIGEPSEELCSDFGVYKINWNELRGGSIFSQRELHNPGLPLYHPSIKAGTVKCSRWSPKRRRWTIKHRLTPGDRPLSRPLELRVGSSGFMWRPNMWKTSRERLLRTI